MTTRKSKKLTKGSNTEQLRVDLERTQQELKEADTALIKAMQGSVKAFEAGYQRALKEVQDFLKDYAERLPIELWDTGGLQRNTLLMFAKRASMHIGVFKPLEVSLEVIQDAEKDTNDAEDDEKSSADGSSTSI